MTPRIDALTRRGFLGLVGVGATGLWLAGCTSDAPPAAVPSGDPRVVARAVRGDTAAVDVRVGLILGPPSMGLSRFLRAARDGTTYNRFAFDVTGIDYAALAARFNQGDFDIVTLPSNLGAVLYNNTDIETEVEVISVNNLGVLYIVTTDPGIAGLDDLRGRTVYSIGEGGTPEFTIATVLDGHGLGDEVQLSFRPTPFEVLNLLQQEDDAIAMLPQPFVELARTMAPGLRTPVDITEAWATMPGNTSGSQAVTTHTVVNRRFLEEHETAVLEYLRLAGESVDYTLDNIADAASHQEELGTFLNDEVAARAMPFCSIVNLTGEVMHEALSGFLQALHRRDPASIGGAMPGADFYYMPPSGALDVDIRTLIDQLGTSGERK